jgi:hypothetical protein
MRNYHFAIGRDSLIEKNPKKSSKRSNELKMTTEIILKGTISSFA